MPLGIRDWLHSTRAMVGQAAAMMSMIAEAAAGAVAKRAVSGVTANVVWLSPTQ